MELECRVPCYSPLVGQREPTTGRLIFGHEGTEEKMEVACGSCIGCRLDRSRMWMARLVHESAMHEHARGNCFVTLTYRDKEVCTQDQLKAGFFIPDDWSLSTPTKKGAGHFQRFMKRLRLARPGDKIKFYMCGEYGKRCMHGIDLEEVKCPMCNLGRPHYHAILFNVCFPDAYVRCVERGVERRTSPELDKLWPYGFNDVGEVTAQSTAYVARYIMDKVTGDQAEDWYRRVDEFSEVINLPPEFSTMSNGIGKGWIEEFKSDVYPSNDLPNGKYCLL